MLGLASGLGAERRGRGAGARRARSDRRVPGGLCRAWLHRRDPAGPAPPSRLVPWSGPGAGGRCGGCCGPAAARKVPARLSRRAVSQRPGPARRRFGRSVQRRQSSPGPPGPAPGPPCPPPGSTPRTARPGTWGPCLARRRRLGSRASATACSWSAIRPPAPGTTYCPCPRTRGCLTTSSTRCPTAASRSGTRSSTTCRPCWSSTRSTTWTPPRSSSRRPGARRACAGGGRGWTRGPLFGTGLLSGGHSEPKAVSGSGSLLMKGCVLNVLSCG